MRPTVLTHNAMSSSGLTGRPGIRRRIDSIGGGSDYWMPAFAGMTNNEERQ
jgi:hypothetical protein